MGNGLTNRPELGINEDLLSEYLQGTSRRSKIKGGDELAPSEVKMFTGGVDFNTVRETLKSDNVNIFHGDTEKRLGEAQGAATKWGNFAVQVGAEVLGGTIEGMGYLGDVQGAAQLLNGDMDSFGNWLSDIGVGMKEGSREHFPIFGANDMSNLGFWLSNGVSVASSLSLLIPAAGAVRGVSALGKAVGLAGKFGKQTKAVMSTLGHAFASRHMESNMESRGVFDETQKAMLQAGKSVSEANLSASEAASNLYMANYALMAQDYMQYKLLLRGPKVNADITSRRLAKALGVNPAKVTSKTMYQYLKDMGKEGIEEGLQFVFSEEAKYAALRDAGVVKESELGDRLGKYSKNSELWTSMLFGALGAGVMQGSRKLTDAAGITGKGQKEALEERIKHAKEAHEMSTQASVKLQAAIKKGDSAAIQQAEREMVFNIAYNAAKVGNFDLAMATIDDLADSDEQEATQGETSFSPDYKERLKKIKSDMKEVGKLYTRNAKKFEGSTVRALTALQYNNRVFSREIPALRNKETQLKSEIPLTGDLSTEGQEVLDTKAEKLGLERSIEVQETIAENSEKTSIMHKRATKRAENLRNQLKIVEKDLTTLEKREEDSIVLDKGDPNDVNTAYITSGNTNKKRVEKDRKILKGLNKDSELVETISSRLHAETIVEETTKDIEELMSKKGQKARAESEKALAKKIEELEKAAADAARVAAAEGEKEEREKSVKKSVTKSEKKKREEEEKRKRAEANAEEGGFEETNIGLEDLKDSDIEEALNDPNLEADLKQVLEEEKERRRLEKEEEEKEEKVVTGNQIVSSFDTGEIEVASNEDLAELNDDLIAYSSSEVDYIAKSGYAIAWRTATGLGTVELAEYIGDENKDNAIALSQFLEDPSIDKTKYRLKFFVDKDRLRESELLEEGVQDDLKALYEKLKTTSSPKDLTKEELGILPVKAYIINEKGERLTHKGGKPTTAAIHDTTFSRWNELNEVDRQKAIDETVAIKEKILSAQIEGKESTAAIEEVNNGHIMNLKNKKEKNNLVIATGMDPSQMTLAMGDQAASGHSGRYVSKPKDRIETVDDLAAYKSATPGAVYLIVKTANGNSFPLRTFIDNLTVDEANLVYELYAKTFEDPSFYKENLGKHPDLLGLITNSEDPRVSGLAEIVDLDKITIANLLKVLVYEGQQTKNSGAGALFSAKESIMIGGNNISKEDFLTEDGKDAFIEELGNKRRQVSITLLNNPAYVKYLATNDILTTNATNVNGAMFRHPTTKFGEVEINTPSTKVEKKPEVVKKTTPTKKTPVKPPAGKTKAEVVKEQEEQETKEIARFSEDKNTKEISIDDFLNDKRTNPADKLILELIKEFWNGKILYQDNWNFDVKNELIKEDMNWGATFDPKTSNILIFRKGNKTVDTVIHEAMHVLLQTSLEEYRGQGLEAEFDPVFSSEINRIFEAFKSQASPKMLADFSYALSNPHEFLSEAFGDAAFRRALAGIKDPGKTGNILTNFVEAIKKLFKDVYDFDISDSMLESIFTATSQTLSPSSVQTETREQKEQKVVKKYRRRQIDVDGLPVQSLSQPLKKGVTKKYVSTRQSTDNNTSWETVVEEVDAVEIGEYEGYSIYAYKSQAGHYVVFEESTGISIGLPDVKSQKDAKARFKNHIKKNSKGQPFKKVLDETVSPVRKMNAEIAALETTEETTEETTTDTTTEVTNSDLDLLKKYKKTRKDVNNIFELKDWALKEPIQNGDTTITHIIPDPASGTFDVIFDRKETGNWKAKFRFKNGKLKLDLYTNQGTINAPSFVSPSEYSQDFMDKSIAAAIPSDLISSIENDLRSVPKQTDSKMNPTDFAYTESIDKKYGISKTLGDVINELKGATPTTTTENKGKAVVEKIKADVKEKGIKVQKDKNGNQTDFYIDKLKNTWKRVTSFCNPMDPASKKKVVVQSSLKIGNKVDDLIRDFFEEGSTLSSKDDLGYLHDKYQLGDGGMTAKFLKQLEGLREYFKQRGENVVASGIILHSDELGVAGTVDLLTYDNNGDIRIYDIKTMKSNQLVNSYKGYDTVIYDTDYIDPISGKKNRSNRKKHTDQLSAYNLILEKTYGVKAVQLGILPVEVSYGKTKVVSETKKLDLVSPAEGFFIDIKNDPDVLIKAAARNKKTDSKKTTVKKVEEPSEITEEKAIEEDRKLGAVTGLERLKQKRREREAREARNKGKNVKKTPVKKTIENKVKDKIDKLIVEDDIGDGLDLNVDDIGTTQEFDPEKENEVSNKRGPKPKPAESRIQPADKVIWAHPTMGKTTLRKTNDNVLDFDTDYKPAIAKELGLPKNKQNSVGLNEARAGNPAFNERFKVAMRKAWTKAKQEAKAQDKALLVSDMMFLEENGQDFDRVVTTSAETFKTRSDNRGDNLFGISEYKSSLDEKVSKVSKDKVITTDKYLSEIFPSSETPRGLMPKSASPNEGTITQQEIDEVANMVPANVATEVIEDYVTLLDGGQAVVGLFQAGLVTISRKAQSGDGYHEAFHAVFRTMLNTKQQQELLQEARDMFMPLESEIENLRILHGISEEAAEDLFYEEQLADEFGVYASNPRAYPFNGKKGRQNYFERLLAWINDILGVTGNIEKIFKNVKQGNFNKANNVDLLIQSRVVESVNDKTGKPC